MRLLRFGEVGSERPGLLDDAGVIRDLSAVIVDLDPTTLSDSVLDRLRALDPQTLPAVDAAVRIGPCVGRVGKIVCIALNYTDHAAETGARPPAEPILFMKATSAIIGPNDAVVLPRGSEQTDWEVELGVVIGTRAADIEQEDALRHVAGYCVVNDISERAFQKDRGGQWTKGKSADTFAPLGPWLVTRDAVPDPNALGLWLDVDGVRQQQGNTANMIFDVPFLISYVSRFMSLQPGDVIATGTPAGVGLGRSPAVFLRAGNVMRLGVDGLGEQCQTVHANQSAQAAT